MRCLVLLFATLLGTSATVSAQSVDPASQDELIQALRLRIEQLERQMEQVLAGRTSQTKPEPAKSSLPVAHAERHEDEATSPSEVTNYPSFRLGGFTDINFSATDQPGTRSGFNEGQFVLHVNSNLSSKISFLGELSMTARADAGTGAPAATGFNVEVERSIIRFEQSDYLKISFGRYHTPINYWNTAFHHGAWLQTTVSRPEMVQFGGRFIPVHFVGALVEGSVPASGLNLNYNLGLGNGRGAVLSRGGDLGDNNNNRAWLVSVFAKPDRLFGLRFGASIYRDKIAPAGTREAREWIQSAHLVWQKENPEIIAEFANVTHQLIGETLKFNSQAWYVQIGYRLPGYVLWKPYYRFEYIHIPKSDPIFTSVPGLAGSVVGVRYDLSDLVALKFEYRHQRRPGIVPINSVYVQTSFTF
jgi:hypothetical protein